MVKSTNLTRSMLMWVVCSTIAGCVTDAPPKGYAEKVARLSTVIKKQRQELDQLKDENRVLRKQAGVFGIAVPTPASSPQKRLSEKDLYKEVIEAYRGQQEDALKNLHQSLVGQYPNSSFADNSAYLVGDLNFARGDYGESLKYFDEVVKKYPKGNKRSAALIGKARAYEKLNLPQRAVDVYAEVLKLSPKSPEAEVAKKQMSLLR